jgi:predicted dehydrogenase
MSQALPIALIGCGAVTEVFYTPTLIELEKEGIYSVRGLIDPSSERRDAIGAFFPDARRGGDLSEISGIKAIVVASPPAYHARQAVQALEAGLDVFCEKPMAATSGEAETMIAAARKHQRILAVGLFRRFFPAVRYVRHLIKSRQFGALKSFAIQEGGLFLWPTKSDAFFRREGGGGGTLLDFGVHVLDIVIYWLGDPERVEYADDAMGNLETTCAINLGYAGGVTGSILLTRDWQTSNSFRFEFENAVVTVDAGDCQSVRVILKGTPLELAGKLEEVRFPGLPAQPSVTYPQAFAEQLRDFAEAVQTRRAPCVPGEEAIRSLRLIEHCYVNRKLRRMPWLTETEWKRACGLAGTGAA